MFCFSEIGCFGIAANMTDSEIFETYLKNTPDNTVGTINEAFLNYNLKDEIRMCPFVKLNGTCFKGNRCKLNHDISNKSR